MNRDIPHVNYELLDAEMLHAANMPLQLNTDLAVGIHLVAAVQIVLATVDGIDPRSRSIYERFQRDMMENLPIPTLHRKLLEAPTPSSRKSRRR